MTEGLESTGTLELSSTVIQAIVEGVTQKLRHDGSSGTPTLGEPSGSEGATGSPGTATADKEGMWLVAFGVKLAKKKKMG